MDNILIIGLLERKSKGEVKKQDRTLCEAIQENLDVPFHFGYTKELPDVGRNDMDDLSPGIIEEIKTWVKLNGHMDRLAVYDSTRLGFCNALKLCNFIDALDGLGVKLWIVEEDLLVDSKSKKFNDQLIDVIDGNTFSKKEYKKISGRYVNGVKNCVAARHKFKKDLFGYDTRVFNPADHHVFDLRKLGVKRYEGCYHIPKDKRSKKTKEYLNTAILRLKINPDGSTERVDDIWAADKNGQLIHINNRPQGPNYSYNKFIKNPDASTVLLAFQLMEQYNTYLEVSNHLNGLGLKFNGSKFLPVKIGYLLKNHTYAGEYWYKGQQLDISPENKAELQIVPTDLFYRIQKKIEPFKSTSKKKKATEDWIKQFIVCGACGKDLTARQDSRSPGTVSCQYRCKICKRTSGNHPGTSHGFIEKIMKDWLKDLPSFGPPVDMYKIFGDFDNIYLHGDEALLKKFELLEKYYEHDNSLLAQTIKAAAGINSFVLKHKEYLPADADWSNALPLYRILRDNLVVLHTDELNALKSQREIDQQAYRESQDPFWLESVSNAGVKIKQLEVAQGRDLEAEFNAINSLYQKARQSAAESGKHILELSGYAIGEALRQKDSNGLQWLKKIKVFFSPLNRKVNSVNIVSDKLETKIVDCSGWKHHIPHFSKEWREQQSLRMKERYKK